MTFRVVMHRMAVADLQEAYDWAAERAPLTASRWLDRFEVALQTLSHRPERCPLARENGKLDIELREFHYGKRPYVFRVIFSIDGDAVRVLRIRRAQRRDLRRNELEQARQTEA